ncbi:hypothetical protein CSUI_007609, partial [Cystoisospora suis]
RSPDYKNFEISPLSQHSRKATLHSGVTYEKKRVTSRKISHRTTNSLHVVMVGRCACTDFRCLRTPLLPSGSVLPLKRSG